MEICCAKSFLKDKRNFLGLRVDFAENLLFIGMEFVFSVFTAARGIRSVINLSLPIPLFLQDPHKAELKRQKYMRYKQSRLRLRVLRRDHYRCRGCDQKGDEITLKAQQIHRDSSRSEGFLTLCTPCQHLVQRLDPRSDQIPDVLQQIWRHVYPRRDQCRK